MIKKHNFKINLKKKSVSITTQPQIFPTPVIMSAAYHFIDDAEVIVDGNPQEKIIVTFVLNKDNIKKSDLEKLGYEFNVQLITSFLEDLQARRYANIRNSMIQAALNPNILQKAKKR